MSNFSINVQQLEGNISKIDIGGYLDAHTFDEFESTLIDLFDEGEYKIIVDMSEVPYISSAGAGVFIWAHSQANNNDGDIVIMKPSANVSEVLELLGLDQVFKIVSNLEAGLKTFA
ncbi:MAG: anti-anti-sigma factor [Planctomycetota bacterium]|nr:MAG: anti-anti-sigma factor [Planctomycetota bacterium]